MPRLTFSELAAMIGGAVIQGGDVEATSVVIDSREVKPGAVFFAIKGDRLDGHDFLPQALQTARGAVVSSVPDDSRTKRSSKSTTRPCAAAAREVDPRALRLPVIGVTGSAGKTTTKEMIATLIGTSGARSSRGATSTI